MICKVNKAAALMKNADHVQAISKVLKDTRYF